LSGKNRETANVGAGNWRGVGMWAWLLHRVSGLVLVAYLFAHIIVVSQAQKGSETFDKLFKTLESPLFVVLDLVLLGAVLYHMMNGIRVLLFDLGVAIRKQKTVFYAVIGVGIAVLAVFAVVSFNFILS
jgi:succinate dehydrogenase / fumarate reductase, cytochrome b subunit